MKATRNQARIQLGVLIGVLLFLGTILVARTLSRGDDFLVFYRVAQRFWDGVRPYDQVTYGNMVFKYPPWILPAFLPFGFFDLWAAKLLWGLVEAFSLTMMVIRIHRGIGVLPEVRPWVQALFLLSLFGLIGSHGMTGQITLSVLAISLWVDPVRSSFLKFFALVWSLSAKMTSLFPLIYLLVARPRRKRLVATGLVCGLFFIILSLPIYFRSYERHYAALRDEWATAMFSGTDDVNSVRIGFTTREVQGLPSLLLRKGGLDEKKSPHVLFAIVFSTLLIGGVWYGLSKKLDSHAQWIGWLALLPAVQPLAWFHVFLFTYPLLVFGTEAALRGARPRLAWGFLGCALLIGAVTVKTLGSVGESLELFSVKLWGTFIAVWLFRKVSMKSA